MNRSVVRAFQGIVLSLGAPSVWLIFRLLAGHSFNEELIVNLAVYLYMLFGSCFVFALFGWYVGSKEELLKSQALHDDLTGLYNSRYFSERLQVELAAAARQGTQLALLLIDLDHFKIINDQFGHIVGNQVLQKLGHTLNTISRKNEIAYRIGGDEFGVILTSCDWIGAYGAASRFYENVRATRIESKKHPAIQITASFGIAVSENKALLDANELMSRADKAMYDAKAKGRDRIEPKDIALKSKRSQQHML